MSFVISGISGPKGYAASVTLVIHGGQLVVPYWCYPVDWLTREVGGVGKGQPVDKTTFLSQAHLTKF